MAWVRAASISSVAVEAACHWPLGNLKRHCHWRLLGRLKIVSSPRNNRIVLDESWIVLFWKKYCKFCKPSVRLRDAYSLNSFRLLDDQFLRTWATFVQAPVFGEIWFHHKDCKPFSNYVFNTCLAGGLTMPWAILQSKAAMPKYHSGSAVNNHFAITQIKICWLCVFELA